MTGAGHNLFRRCVHRAASSSLSFPLSPKSLYVKPKALSVSFSGKTTTAWPVMQSPSNDRKFALKDIASILLGLSHWVTDEHY